MSKQFEALSEFVLRKMTMSHVYQPVMLIELLTRGGRATVNEIAKAISSRDVVQIEYYENVVTGMVGRVLTKNRGITKKDGKSYLLNGFEELSHDEIAQLIAFCDARLEDYVKKRGNEMWKDKMATRYIPGTLKYEVLERAKSRCELCGVSAEEKQLQVDHIIPRSKEGSNDISNLQALCYSCNSMKGNRDDTDFRNVAASYHDRKKGCIFCKAPKKRIIVENELAYLMHDAHPVTDLHALIIPKRHVEDVFDLYQPERNAINQLMEAHRCHILKTDNRVLGFNVGNNVGVEAGQTIMHSHTHLIPRRKGDVAEPRGGVRGVIPGKQSY